MGFKVEINSILRFDEHLDLKIGEIYPFEKSGSRIFFDDIPIWLTKMDWTALAEIKVVTQTRLANKVSGEFQVLHIYTEEEQAVLTKIFLRMFNLQ